MQAIRVKLLAVSLVTLSWVCQGSVVCIKLMLSGKEEARDWLSVWEQKRKKERENSTDQGTFFLLQDYMIQIKMNKQTQYNVTHLVL